MAPQELIDDQLAGFTEGEVKVLLTVIRATNGGQRESVPLSIRAFVHGGVADILPGRGTGLSPRTVQAACASLETAGYLRVTHRTAPDGSGLPSLFSLPLVVPGLTSAAEAASPRFPGYSTGRRVRLPLLVIDRLLGELSGAELKVLLYILRHTFSLSTPDEIMSMARLTENTGLSLRHTRLAVAGLSARGIVLVEHRQDPERGKLPSRFGVRVLGEAAPFSALAPAPGVAARAVRSEEPAEPARPVWLVPSPPEEAPPPEVPAAMPAPTPILQVFPHAPALGAAPAIQPEPVAAPSAMTTSVSMPPAAPALATAATPARPTRASTAPAPRVIHASMLRDGHPAWAAVKRTLAEKLPYHYFVQRVANTASVGSGGPDLLIAVQDEHHRWWLEAKLATQVRDALVSAGFPDLRIRYLNFNGVIPTDGDGNHYPPRSETR